nr:uncharacterized protein LOC104651232 [Saimiri boliviensis boliviensis]
MKFGNSQSKTLGLQMREQGHKSGGGADNKCAETLLDGISPLLFSPHLCAQQKKPQLWSRLPSEEQELSLATVWTGQVTGQYKGMAWYWDTVFSLTCRSISVTQRAGPLAALDWLKPEGFRTP